MKHYDVLDEEPHSEYIQEIISKPPSWLLSRGITFIFITITMLIGATAFIRYPEMIAAEVKFTTTVSPKKIVSPTNGTLHKILVKDGASVMEGQEIAYIESTADHEQVLSLLATLQELRESGSASVNLEKIIPPSKLQLGELQTSYQSFYLAYLNYQAAADEGIYNTRKRVLKEEMEIIKQQNQHSKGALQLQQKELSIAEEEYDRYKRLADKKIISPQELRQKESILLSKRQSIPQMESTLLAIQSSILSKNRELAEINNQIFEEEKKFEQAFNSFISEAIIWKRQHVLSAPITGKVVYGGVLQENLYIEAGEELFFINPSRDDYYGESYILQSNSSKIQVGQKVLIEVTSYPHQEYGYLHGTVSYVSDIPIRDGVFFSKISLERTDKDSLIRLKPGITAAADIITEDVSVIKRIWMNLTKSLNF